MDDRFLHEHRRSPDPAFARSLRSRLANLEDETPARASRLRPWLAAAAALVVGGLAFTVPAVRVAAQSALDLFRVRSFAAVQVDEARMREIGDLQDANPAGALMPFERDGEGRDPGEPVEYPTVQAAAAAADLPGVRTPSTLPAELRLERTMVTGEGESRLVVRAERLERLLDALALSDVHVPSGLDGQRIEVRVPHSVVQHYGNGKRKLVVIEARSPEVSLPPGLDLREMGEIGLRVLGLDAAEARRTAATIDWRSTLLVPMPTNAASFRRVEVGGGRGLLVSLAPSKDESGNRRRGGTVVMWSQWDRVHVVRGDVSEQEVLEVALSLR